MNHSSKKPIFFDTDKIFKDYITTFEKSLFFILVNVISNYCLRLILIHILKQIFIIILQVLA